MQTRFQSFIESCVNIAIGFLVSLLVLWAVAILFNLRTSAGENILITCIFTVTSLLRQYAIRRFFNWLHARQHPTLID